MVQTGIMLSEGELKQQVAGTVEVRMAETGGCGSGTSAVGAASVKAALGEEAEQLDSCGLMGG